MRITFDRHLNPNLRSLMSLTLDLFVRVLKVIGIGFGILGLFQALVAALFVSKDFAAGPTRAIAWSLISLVGFVIWFAKSKGRNRVVPVLGALAALFILGGATNRLLH